MDNFFTKGKPSKRQYVTVPSGYDSNMEILLFGCLCLERLESSDITDIITSPLLPIAQKCPPITEMFRIFRCSSVISDPLSTT